MTTATKSGEPVLAWLTNRTEASRKSDVDFDNASLEYRRLFSELWGTFLLVLVAAGGGVVGALPIGGDLTLAMKALAPGMMVMGIIFFMGTISGAHLNPAVTLAFAARGNFPWIRVPGYIVAQIIGGILAALFLQWRLRRNPQRRHGTWRRHLGRDGSPDRGDPHRRPRQRDPRHGIGRQERRRQRSHRRGRVHRPRVRVGRTNLGRLDEPGSVVGPDARRRQPRPLLGLPRRPDRRRTGRGWIRVHPSRPSDEGRRRGGPGHPRRGPHRRLIDQAWPERARRDPRA